jgi:D-alanyl-D-alanine carboxypeptidase
MSATDCSAAITSNFKREVSKAGKVKNAFLRVYSEKMGVDLKLAEGETAGKPAHPDQPMHMASVGKLFTATLIGMLYEEGKIDYSDPIGEYLDADLMNRLHVYKGKEYSSEITVRHLLQQSSGLEDVFFDLLKKMTQKPFEITPREAVEWGKEHKKPVAVPGKKHHYTDTNYYLLGLIIESICNKPHHEVMHEKIFDPLGMKRSWMWEYSSPAESPGHPMATLRIKGDDALSIPGVSRIDYAGGGVVAPTDDSLLFLRALTGHKVISEETLGRMIDDDIYMGFPTLGFDYGYSIWKFRPIPLLLPERLVCWGCVGVTGAFMFYHPPTESHIIGSFNDTSYTSKSLRFMMRRVVKELSNALHDG